MRRDHRPYGAKRLHRSLERRYVEHFIRPQLDSLSGDYQIMKPWNLRLHGACISFGIAPHVVTTRDRPVTLTTWAYEDYQGQIQIDDYVLLCPGTRLDSATKIHIGSNTMLAANVYITDADWHDIYDRAAPIGDTRPVVLEPNTWIGDSSIVCKGVTVGENSVIGAGSVVTGDIPANVIAAGCPARVIRPLDADKTLRLREEMLKDEQKLSRETDDLDRYLHASNSWVGWLRSIVAPKSGD